MAWCTCPVRKGGREVVERTRARHEKELRDKERQRIVQLCFPDRVVPLSGAPRRRRRRPDDDDDTQGNCSKRARKDDKQAGKAETQLVRAPTIIFQLALMS